MGSEAEAAAFRMALRHFAPRLKQTFKDRSEAWGEPVAMLYMTMRYKPGTDMTNVDNVIIEFNSLLSKKCVSATNDPDYRMSDEEKEMLEEAFPAGAVLMDQKAEEWGLSPYDLFMLLRIKSGSGDIDDPDTTEIQVRTRASISPARSELVK